MFNKIKQKIKELKDYKEVSKTYNKLKESGQSYQVLKEISDEIKRIAVLENDYRKLAASPFNYNIVQDIATKVDRKIIIRFLSGEVIEISPKKTDFDEIDNFRNIGRV